MKSRLFLLLTLASPMAALACGPWWYEAPPTIEAYPERLPVKTLGELLAESSPPPVNPTTADRILEDIDGIAEDLGTKPREELLTRIATALTRNREGEYRKGAANLLQDFRDLLTNGDAPPAQITKYATWRLTVLDWDNGLFFEIPSPDNWSYSDEDRAQIAKDRQQQTDDFAKLVHAEIKQAAPSVKPHWQVQLGSWLFKSKDFEEAGKVFEQVLRESPKHPRAEAAQLMLARVRIEEWRVAHKRTSPTPEQLTEQEQLFQSAQTTLTEYLTAYPQGRYAPDIPGWQAGLARENGQWGDAMKLYLQQADVTGHPEVVASAIGGFEACLDDLEPLDLSDDPEAYDFTHNFPLEEVAKRPLAALATVYHYLDSEGRRDIDDYLDRHETTQDGEVIDRFLSHAVLMRRSGRTVLPLLARAVANQKSSYAGSAWQPKYLAILAWAASETGAQDLAVRLCNTTEPQDSDDLLFVGAVARQRQGDWAGAIAGYRLLQEKFPASPLNAESRFRLATALRDHHEAGLAVVEFFQMPVAAGQIYRDNPTEDSVTAPHLHLRSEVEQWADTLMQFSPLAELEGGLAGKDLPPEIATRLHTVLRQRYLAAEDFAGALRHPEPSADPPATPPAGATPPPADPAAEPSEPAEEITSDEGGYPKEFPSAQWKTAVENLAKLTKQAQDQKSAATEYALAEAWAAARGHLTLPSTMEDDLVGSDNYAIWEQRFHNAQAAGFPLDRINTELESRDELRHAYPHYLLAAAPDAGKTVGATALWKANDALRKMAELSPWTAARAFAAGAGAESRKLSDRLRSDYPDSPEARQFNVWWSFAPPAEAEWLPADLTFYKVEAHIYHAFENEPQEEWADDEVYDADEIEQLHALAAATDKEGAAQLLLKLKDIRQEFLPKFKGAGGSPMINHLDDLELALATPDATPLNRKKYIEARLAEGPPDLADPDLAPLLEYATFLALVREEGERPMSERMREFLTKYPQSKKREAALARLAMAQVREYHQHTGIEETVWPDAPKVGGYKELVVTRGETFDKDKIFAGLDAYDKEFPNGRYAADIRLWRGAASIDAGDYQAAIDCLVATLDAKDKRDLHLDAALNLADVFMRLLDEPNHRPEIIAALRANPSAQNRLRQFMHSESLGARLRCLEDFLEEQYK